jgi:hypothetical protein
MKRKRITMSSIVVVTFILVSLCAVASSPTSVSGQTGGPTAPLVTKLVGGTLAGTGPAASTAFGTRNGQTEIFAVDTSGTLWNTSIVPGSNGTWNSLGGVCTSSPAAVSWNTTYLRLDVFVRGADGALWHKYFQNAWSNWESLGGHLAPNTGPAVSSWSAGRLDVFVQGTDGALWHKWYAGASWSGWQSLGGKLTSSPAAMSPFTGSVIYVFARGSDGAVWEKYYQNGWSSWQSLGGQLAPNTGPAVSQDRTLIVQGTNNKLWQKDYTSSGWAAWSVLNTQPAEELSIASPGAVCILANHQLLVCVCSASGNVWYSMRDALGNWEQWDSPGSPPFFNPKLTQGIANDGKYNYVIGNVTLYKYDANWNLLASNPRAGSAVGCDHFGDGDVYNGILYVFGTTLDSPQAELIGLFNVSDLSYIKTINLTQVSGNPPKWNQLNIGGVGVDPDNGNILCVQFGVAGSIVPANVIVFKFDLNTFAYKGYVQGSTPLIYNQGISYYNGRYYFSTSDHNNGGVYTMNTDGTNTTQIIPHSYFTRGGEVEGLDVKSDFIRVLCGGYVYTFPFQVGWGQ